MKIGCKVGCACIVLVGVAALAPAAAAPAATATDLLPDLGLAQLSNIQSQKTSDGRRLLRYTAELVNVGVGAFEVTGRRATPSGDMSVTQRIYNDTGSYRDVATTATMYWAGDGHNHWHTRDLETAELDRLDNGVKVGTLVKHGFCFYDTASYNLSLPGAPQSKVYTGCGYDAAALTVTTGLSVGWGDVYYYTLPDQYIDITGLSPGRYRLKSEADKTNWFVESSESNNATWVDLELKAKGNGIRILSYGPHA
jgi:hypothetical protein